MRGDRVHLPKGLARKLCATAPREYVQRARNPERDVTIGGKGLVLAPVYGPPFVRDLEGGRRYATIEDFRNFVKLAYSSKWLHHSGGTVCEPTDVAVNKRHLDMLLAHMTLSDKPFMGSVTAPERAADSVEMCRILFGAENVGPNCYMTSLININSPLVFDATMMGALEVYARAGQATIVSPFIVGGAMAPVSVAGTLTQVLAEAMTGIAYAQLVNPGCPVIFGAFVDLDRHELGGADLRHARGLEDPLGRRPAGAAAEPAVPLGRRRSAARSCRTRRRPTRAPTRCRRRCSAGSTSCCTPAAGSRAGWCRPTRSSCSTPTSSGCCTRWPRGSTSARTARRWTRCARWGRAGITSAARTPRRTSRTPSGAAQVLDYRPFETWAEAGAPEFGGAGERAGAEAARRVPGAGDRPGGRGGAERLCRPAQGVRARRLRLRPGHARRVGTGPTRKPVASIAATSIPGGRR